MRRYIRHPSDIPIEYEIQNAAESRAERLSNVSLGGLSFFSSTEVSIGSTIRVRISMVQPQFEASGKVVWCFRHDEHYEVGIELTDHDEAYRARMIEQVCHIEHYKRDVLQKEGRKLTGEQAAMEWISKYAAEFPKLGELEHS